MERELHHFSHEHPLILKAEGSWLRFCDVCSKFCEDPFYSCDECNYDLHKVCAELPKEMKYPMHPQHPLTLLSSFNCLCDMCNITCDGFVYHCSICKFYVDPVCASASHTIEDKCHQHPLTPIQHCISLPCCNICQTQEKGLSYKCNTCPFWVHQKCTLSLPSTINHGYHHHPLTFSQYMPQECCKIVTKCDICYNPISSFGNMYCCTRCLFCAHVICAISEEESQSPRSRDENVDIALLPVQQKSTDLISWFAKHVVKDIIIRKEITFVNHEHPLIPIDDQVNEICDSCALPISTPSYGCIDCRYFLHKYCNELPKQISHPSHTHQISLIPPTSIFWCSLCYQCSNGFGYKCFQCGDFRIDIKCASFLFRIVKHEAHKHPLSPAYISYTACSACGKKPPFNYCILQCYTCSFSLCFMCAMAPSIMKHRWDEHPFMLTYSPPESHYNEYICDLCEKDLNPKHWFYHCRLCDQSTHISCMLSRGADSNIKYGKRYKFIDHHEHELALISCTYDSSLCKKCGLAMRTGYNVGLECIPCHFKIHLQCALDSPTSLPN